MNDIKYVHTNLVAKDWRKLAEFYINVFDCKPIYPERDLAGEWVDELTSMENVRIRGIHLALPGYENGPTLEIFGYEPGDLLGDIPKISKQGIRHLAFHVDSVEDVMDRMIKYGGEKLGEIVRVEMEGIGILTAVYAKDPEGNYVEIQHWDR